MKFTETDRFTALEVPFHLLLDAMEELQRDWLKTTGKEISQQELWRALNEAFGNLLDSGRRPAGS